MSEELAIIQEQNRKLEIKNKKENISILKQVLEPIEEAFTELKDVIQEAVNLEKKEKPQQIYFDKDFNSKLASSLDKVFNLISKFKLPESKPIDLSPINNIALEIKKQNDSIIQLLNKPNQSEELHRLIIAMVGKQNSFLERELKGTDYSQQLQKISESISNKTNERVEKLTVVYEYGSIKEVIPIYKK